MFNVMVTASSNAWEEGAYVWDRTRVLEHTPEAIRGPLLALTGPILEELAKLPTLFMYEQIAEGTPRVGYIRRIQQRGSEVRVIFEFDVAVPPLTTDAILDMRWDLQLLDLEFSRTHWAVKDGDLIAILRAHGFAAQETALPDPQPEPESAPAPAVEVTPAKVFLVHGRNEAAKHSVARFLERRVGLDVVILSERPNRGRSILTKFQEEAGGATFAVVLMTGDDLGHLRPEMLAAGELRAAPMPRPRQNVLFEMGFFIGQLGVDRVAGPYQKLAK